MYLLAILSIKNAFITIVHANEVIIKLCYYRKMHVLPIPQLRAVTGSLLKQLTSRLYWKIISYKYFIISLQIYIIVVRNKKTTYFHVFALKKKTIRFSAIGIFLLYITATALVTQKIMQRKTMFYQRFFNWIKGSVIIDFSTEHNLTSIYRYFFHLMFWASRGTLL